MNRSSQRRPFAQTFLATAVAAFVGFAVTGAAFAQDSEDEDLEDKPKATSLRGSAQAASEMARKRKEEAKAKAAEEPARYPLATRVPPTPKNNAKDVATAKDVRADYDGQKYADVIAKTEAYAAGSNNAYIKSFLYQLAANAAIDMNDMEKGIGYYQKALETSGLDNNGHYQIMYNLAVMQAREDKNADALATLERFLAETKSDGEEAIGFKVDLLQRLDRVPEAVALYEKLVAQKPNDRATLLNAINLYQRIGDEKRVASLLESIRKQNLLTDKDGQAYRMLYVGYIDGNKLKDAVSMIDEGIAKGAIKPNQTLANDYAVIAQKAYLEQEDTALAIDMYKRSAAISGNGEAALNLAKVLRNEGRMGEAKEAARQALAKGVKKPEDANKIINAPGK